MKVPKVDIAIDDGGHIMQQQIVTFEELYNHMHEEGVYLVEDCKTLFDARFKVGRLKGGFSRNSTWIEYAKQLVDELYAQYWANGELSLIARSKMSIAFYDQIVVFEKGPHLKAKDVKRGSVWMDYMPERIEGQVNPEVCRDLAAKYSVPETVCG